MTKLQRAFKKLILKTEIENFTIIAENLKPRQYLAPGSLFLRNRLARHSCEMEKPVKVFFTTF